MRKDKIDNKVLLRFISGKASEEEKCEILEWIEGNDANMENFIKLKNDYVYNQMAGYNRISRRRVFINKTLKYAALFIALIMVNYAGFYLYQSFKPSVEYQQKTASFKYLVNSGVKGVVDLPDGSKVWLNSSSYIICPERFSNICREIELIGEGYFEVVPDKNWPMIIKTSKDLTIKVTGTSFNLSSYPDDDKLILTLISGEVTVINQRINKEFKMTPNQELVLKQDSLKMSNNANIPNNTAWKNGLLLFDNTPMKEVIKKMERWYGITIVVKDNEIYDYRFTAKFRSESVSQVLEILNFSSKIKYNIEGTVITLFAS